MPEFNFDLHTSRIIRSASITVDFLFQRFVIKNSSFYIDICEGLCFKLLCDEPKSGDLKWENTLALLNECGYRLVCKVLSEAA